MNQTIVDHVSKIAKDKFSIPYLYPVQRFVIANILDRKRQIVIFPTGGGKSLCFQLPVFLLSGVSIIIVPLLSLMEDQLRKLKKLNIEAGVIKGGQTKKERDRIIRGIKVGRMKIVYITPEAAVSDTVKRQLNSIKISHLVIDEAHCVTEWGESFRPAYLKLNTLIETLHIQLISAFTATASESIIEKIRTIIFNDEAVYTVIANPDRRNIKYSVIPTISKFHTLEMLVTTRRTPLIIFTRSRKRCEQAARVLKDRLSRDEIYFYHAGLYKEERKKVEDWFLHSGEGILTATSAYGMGIDKSNVRTVVHCDVPLSIESYLQESGRAGRDNSEAEALLLYSDEDLRFKNTIHDPVQKNRYENMLHYVTANNVCRREALLSFLDYKFEEACSGCDYCEGSIVSEIAEKNKILEFIKKNKRMYTLRELKQIFAGKKTYEVIMKDLDCAPAFGLLSSWNPADIEEALHCFIDSGKIYIPQKGFWKQRITLGKQGGEKRIFG